MPSIQENVRRILAELPADRQNMLFGATMPREIRLLAERILRDPVTVELAHAGPADFLSCFAMALLVITTDDTEPAQSPPVTASPPSSSRG